MNLKQRVDALEGATNDKVEILNEDDFETYADLRAAIDESKASLVITLSRGEGFDDDPRPKASEWVPATKH